MPGPGGGSRGGGGGRGGFGGGHGGFGGGHRGPGGFGGPPHHHHHHHHRGWFFGPRYYGGGCLSGVMAMFMLPVVLVLIAVMLIFSVFGSAFSTITNGGDVEYNENIYQDYANDMYYQEFASSTAFEDNLLLVFLVEENYYDYNFIAWVGDDIKTDVNYMFGNESSELGKAISGSSIHSDSYKYSFGQGISQVMDTMGAKIDALSLESSFICDEERSGVNSHITNYTDLIINDATVNRSLEDFTAKTGIPVVVVVQYQETVFGKTISPADIISLIIAIALIVLAVVIFVRFLKKKDNGNNNYHNNGNNSNYY